MTKCLRFPLVVLLLLAASTVAASPAEPASKPIPEPLRPWQSWVTWDQDHLQCPTPFNDSQKHLCFWPARLAITVGIEGGTFDLGVTVFSETWVPLPGGTEAWPVEVKADDAAVAVTEHDSHPSVRLAPGVHRLAGAFRWKEIPQRIPLPVEIGVLALTVEGKPVEAPAWDAGGLLWLKRDGSGEEADKDFLSVKVYAALEDGIPLWLRTEVELTVSGKSREVELGTILPEGWKLTSVESSIPVAVDAVGQLKAQVRAGKWTVKADAFRLDNPKELRFAAGAKPAAAEVLLAFRAQPDFRLVEITGAPSIDVSQTTVPAQWRELPVFRWETSAALKLEERVRGMGLQKPAGLTFARELWLDENGRGLTFRDRITGAMQHLWRLDAAAGEDLGSVRAGGQGQLITRNPQNGAPGVELRTRNLDLEATGRMERPRELSATGWRTDADALNVTLNLPPGWQLFALFGADWVRGDWLTAWTLLDLFLLLIFSLAVSRLWSRPAGLLAFLAFGLAYHEPGAPRYLWLILLMPLALLRVVPPGWGRRLLLVWKWGTIAAFALVFVPFIAQQVQQAIYPQLENTSSFGPHFLSERFETRAVANETVPGAAGTLSGEALVRQKLDQIIIPKLEFKENTVKEAVDFLRNKSVEFDTAATGGTRGVNMVFKLDANAGSGSAPPIPGLGALPPFTPVNSADARITVSLTNIPLAEALRYVTNLAGLKYKVEPWGVTIVPVSMSTDTYITKEFKVRPDLIGRGPGDTNSVSKGGAGIAKREAAKDWLIGNGTTFGPNASAIYIPSSGKLIVRNTQEQIDLIEAIISAGESGGPNDNLSYDAKARIQTGPGVPEWTWRTASFGFNGPVLAAQNVRPILIPLPLQRVLTVLRVALLLWLAAVLLGARELGGAITPPATKGVATALALLFLGLSATRAQVPDKATLDLLRERLIKPSDAYPHAADIPSVTLTLRERRITIDAEIHAAIRTAVPLPGKLPTWSPLTVLVDDQPEPALRRGDGFLWVVVEPGVHRVRVEGQLADATEWEWTFQLRPRRVTIDAPGWTVSGVKPDGAPEAQVFFVQQQKSAASQASYERQDLQSLVSIDRQLELGLVWQVRTTITRQSSAGKAIALRIPLLPGENVLSSTATVRDGAIDVRLGAQEASFSWESSLPVSKQLTLATRAEDAWVERWTLVASPVWNVTVTGLAPIFAESNAALVPVWQPWPGESVQLAISRPEALAGATATINKATHEISLGQRQRNSRLDLSLRCSLGEDFLIGLPADAEVTTLTQSGSAIPVRKDGNKVVIPLRPGEQNISIGWKTNTVLGFQAVAGRVQLPVESANLNTVINVPESRWLLWADGPRRGPAVRFWGILVCSLLAAWALGSAAFSPLRRIEWMLLVIGLTQAPLPAALAVVGWLFALAWRGRPTFQEQKNASYNVAQILLILLTAAALGTLLTVVGEGLLGAPEMFVSGNGSTHTALRWYQARCGTELPTPRCFSVSIWWYRFLMLAWALWLAAALIRWLRWAWQQFSSGGFFRKKVKPVATPPTPVAVPPPLPVKPVA